MNHSPLVLASVAILVLTGCSHSSAPAPLTSEIGRGTFVSASGETVTALYFKTGDTEDQTAVRLVLPNQSQAELDLAPSGSGARYTNHTAEWWEHQGEATYAVDGKTIFRGKNVPIE